MIRGKEKKITKETQKQGDEKRSGARSRKVKGRYNESECGVCNV